MDPSKIRSFTLSRLRLSRGRLRFKLSSSRNLGFRALGLGFNLGSQNVSTLSRKPSTLKPKILMEP